MKKIILLICIISPLFALNLSKEEKAYLKEHPIIKVGADSNYPPFEYYENGQFKGIAIDLLKRIEKKLHVRFEFITSPSWSGVTKLAREKKVDFLSCLTKTTQRSRYLDFSEPYLSFPMAIAANTSTGYIDGLEDLRGKNVSVIQEYAESDILEEKYKDIYISQNKSLRSALESVSSGKTFAYVGNLAQVIYISQKYGLSNLFISGITNYKFNYSFGVTKGNDLLLSILSKALKSIHKDEIESLVCKWLPLHVKEKSETNNSLYYLLVLFLCIIIIVFLYKSFQKNLKQKLHKILSQNEQINSLKQCLILSNLGFIRIDLTKKLILQVHNIPLNQVLNEPVLIDDFKLAFIDSNDINKFDESFNSFITCKEIDRKFKLKIVQNNTTKPVTFLMHKSKFDHFNNPLQIDCVIIFG